MSFDRLEFPDRGWPILLETDKNDDLVRVLLYEDWYDPVMEAAKWLKHANEIVVVTEMPSTVQKIADLVQNLAGAGIYGWHFSFSIVSLLALIAYKIVSVGKFTYVAVSGVKARRGTGWLPTTIMTGKDGELVPRVRVKELPTEE